MASSAAYDRLRELKAFDATKAGVKGLVDAGVTAVPRIFHDPAAAAADQESSSSPGHDVAGSSSRVPVIDLAAGARPDVVAQVKEAAETVGFFQVVNHGVPTELLAEMLDSIRRFHEQPAEAKAPYYSRDPARRVRYQSNFDLFTSPAANWRDTLFMVISPESEEEIPAPCRAVLPEYTREVKKLGATLFELLSEAMGLGPGYLQHEAGCLDDGLSVGGHYYPPCPEPHLTMGTPKHSDPSFLTVLLQDHVGGLQVLVPDNEGGSQVWVDVPPVAGALVVNVGDFLQLVSNDRFRSVEHRVRATPAAAGARVSVGCFFRTTDGGKVYGPIVQKDDEPPRYRSVTVPEFVRYYMNKGLDGRSALDHFRL